MSDVEVIILDLDGGEMLSECLKSIAIQTRLPRRVTVWDNGSLVPTRERVDGTFPFELKILRSETNLGFTGGINEAMRSVEAPLVAWINNDVVLDREWMAAMEAHFQPGGRIAAVQSWIRRDRDKLDGAGIDISAGVFRQLHHGLPLDVASAEEAWGVSATAALYRVEALQQTAVHGNALHAGFYAYYEDVELSARLLAAGWELRVDSRPLATHGGSRTADRLGLYGERLRVRNRYFVHRLHPGIGNVPALLKEDFRRAARAMKNADPAAFCVIAAAVCEGLVRPVLGDRRQEIGDRR